MKDIVKIERFVECHFLASASSQVLQKRLGAVRVITCEGVINGEEECLGSYKRGETGGNQL